ncbi:MAG: lipopolysaccharide heptosyltransferase II [Candidatus Electrothrix aestuarii]|uniref:lipopolysaccharide heptosyltransferase II n=1 Tax=Candidatus Electrothrix aestuarii TaxID=3062594 RepID=A0AAU8M1X1_9BACT|nr:lipopolysaccharide heptosyltransferase II [Candidatus Electrothrix aestuarii]
MPPIPKTASNILIRSTNWIGDAIMTTPAVRSIRHNFPDAKITLLALPWVADVFRACPHIDHIFIYDKQGHHQGLRGKLRLASELRQQNYDLTILLQNAFEAALITFLARIPIRGGYTTDGRGLLLTHRVRKHPEIKTKHQVHYYQEMIKGLGLQRSENSLELFLDSAAEEDADALIKKALQGGKADDIPIIGLNPGAAYGPAKCWPANKYAELAGRLSDKTGGLIVIFGTAADQQAATEISGAAGERVLDLTGKTTLAQALACIARCSVFITNDSGLMHVAAALNTPLVAVFGSTDHIATGPYSDKASIVRQPVDCSPCMKTHCPKGHFQCMESITVQEVEQAALEWLEKR